MTKTKLFKSISIIFFILAVLHFLGVKFYLDFYYWWYDMVLHFLGGVVVGLVFLWTVNYILKYKNFSSIRSFVWGILFVLIIGVLWEIFELKVGFTDLNDGFRYITDTSSDLILDIFGGFLAILYGLKIKND